MCVCVFYIVFITEKVYYSDNLLYKKYCCLDYIFKMKIIEL